VDWTAEWDIKPSLVIIFICSVIRNLLSITGPAVVAFGYVATKFSTELHQQLLKLHYEDILVMSYFDCVDKAQWFIIFHEVLQRPRPADHCMFVVLHIIWYTSSSDRGAVATRYI